MRILMELWKPVVGWEGRYEVSDQGRVRRVHYLTPALDKDGYSRIQLRRPGKKQQVSIHRVVLEAFVGPRSAGHEACHNNGNEADNRVENLRWDTHSANLLERRQHGFIPPRGSEKHSFIHGRWSRANPEGYRQQKKVYDRVRYLQRKGAKCPVVL